MLSPYKVKFKRKFGVMIEQTFCAKLNADTYAKRNGGWVTDREGFIVADYRPCWRRVLAGWITGLRLRWMRGRARRRAMKSLRGN